jgi:hypothetical protein
MGSIRLNSLIISKGNQGNLLIISKENQGNSIDIIGNG